jgi:hypothetical protein
MGNLNLPTNKPLPGQVEDSPMVLIGDEAFALKPYLLKPFPRRQSHNNIRLDNYNYRLCRARRVVENAFGILTKKWRIYNRPIEVKEETTIKMIMATCILHNFIRVQNCSIDTTEPDENDSISTLGELSINNRRGTNKSLRIRDNFVDFFNS